MGSSTLQVAKNGPFPNEILNKFYQRRDRLHFAIFGLLGFHFLSFWPFGPSFPFILAFWAVISFHFSLLGFHFLSFWPFGPSFPFILAFWAFISFHFGLLGLHFLSFWPFGPSFPSFLACLGCHVGPPPQVAKNGPFPNEIQQMLSAPRPAAFCNFWPFEPSFPFILAFWAFISFHFGLVGLHFFSFWVFGLSFPSFLACLGCHVGSPRGWVHPSVTRSSLLMAPTKEDAAWAASRYILGHGAGFTLR